VDFKIALSNLDVLYFTGDVVHVFFILLTQTHSFPEVASSRSKGKHEFFVVRVSYASP